MAMVRIDPSDIILTDTAKSKCLRLLSQWELQTVVSEVDGRLYRRADSNEYHLLHDEYVISFRVDGGKIIVITQMHEHNDYSYLDTYTETTTIEGYTNS